MVKINFVRQVLAFFKKWLWIKPTEKDKPLKVTDVANNYVCIKFRDQFINLKKSEVPMFNSLSRKDKRGMANKFKNMEKKGLIRFEKINGVMTCIKNKQYGKTSKEQ